MWKRSLAAVVVVFVAWSAMDFLIHGVLLKEIYETTAEMWRPEAEMKMTLMQVVTAISSLAFVVIYGRMVGKKSLVAGLEYGLWIGILVGIGMGYGTYSYMPIPYHLALYWFLGTLARMLVAGLLVGLIVKGECCQAPAE